MVTTNSTQYITDFTPVTAEPGKSPLALLARTCETIGLPEGSAKKSSPHEKKEEKSRADPHHQQQQSKQKASSSPRSTPQSKEPTLTFPGLPKPPAFPMGMPAMMQGFNPFFSPMMTPYQMSAACFPGAFPMAPAGFMGAQRLPCPFAMMRQPCANPACLQCPSSSNGAKNGGPWTAEMLSQFAAHPLFSMYAGMMPGVPSSSYQALLAASAAASASTPPTSSDHPSTSKPSTSSITASISSDQKRSVSASTSSSSSTHAKSQKAPRFQCNWVDSDVPCGKMFEEEHELTGHVKKMHAPSPSSSSASSEPSTSVGKAPRSAAATPHRYNPYGKQAVPPVLPSMGMNMNMAMNPLVLPFSLQAMYSNRLMPTVAHQ